jgi:hypothetical protein
MSLQKCDALQNIPSANASQSAITADQQHEIRRTAPVLPSPAQRQLHRSAMWQPSFHKRQQMTVPKMMDAPFKVNHCLLETAHSPQHLRK